MKQVFQDLKDGSTTIVDVPVPICGDNEVLIRSGASLISPGTEKMLVQFGKASYVQKARQQPDKVRMVLDKVRTDGLVSTIEAVKGKLDQPIPLGYSNVGTVIDVGGSASEFKVGDRVLSNGQHAEYVRVSRNLCAKVPDGVSDDTASFGVLAAIGLQGVRLAEPTIGESFAVIGVGLIGLLTVQILRAHGCRVIAADFDEGRLALARSYGATTVNLAHEDSFVADAVRFSRNNGIDAVLITAATDSNDPVRQAARMCRKRGRIVLIGVAGLELSRADFYEKELSFQVSCSYGPGRYDPGYEEGGNDYPIGFVRWTEQRNFQAVLDLMEMGKIDASNLVSHRYSIGEATAAYDSLTESKSALGIILDYERDAAVDDPVTRDVRVFDLPSSKGETTISIIGSGSYASRVLIPAFKASNVTLRRVVSDRGASGAISARKHGVEFASTDPATVFADMKTQAVVVATRHDSHCEYVLSAISSGKHVFVEKPLCLKLDELEQIRQSLSHANVCLMVGYNRRYSSLVAEAKKLLDDLSAPLSMSMTVNAGFIPADHWTQDPAVGGGRIVGEGCHFIDLLRYMAASPIATLDVFPLGGTQTNQTSRDSATICLTFENGSTGTVHYLANGHRGFPKECLDIFCENRVLRLDNFRTLKGWGWSKFNSKKLWRQDKGQQACVRAFVASIQQGGPMPIPINEILEVAKVSIDAQDAML